MRDFRAMVIYGIVTHFCQFFTIVPYIPIIRVSDQLAAGEIKLTEYSEEESQAAKIRLDEKRAKRRERYTKKSDAIDCI